MVSHQSLFYSPSSKLCSTLVGSSHPADVRCLHSPALSSPSPLDVCNCCRRNLPVHRAAYCPCFISNERLPHSSSLSTLAFFSSGPLAQPFFFLVRLPPFEVSVLPLFFFPSHLPSLPLRVSWQGALVFHVQHYIVGASFVLLSLPISREKKGFQSCLFFSSPPPFLVLRFPYDFLSVQGNGFLPISSS